MKNTVLFCGYLDVFGYFFPFKFWYSKISVIFFIYISQIVQVFILAVNEYKHLFLLLEEILQFLLLGRQLELQIMAAQLQALRVLHTHQEGEQKRSNANSFLLQKHPPTTSHNPASVP